MNAIVTGASQGIGRAIVEKFAQSSINVWACASRENEQLEEYAKELEAQYGVWIKPVYFDLRDEDQAKKQLGQIVNEKKPIDILVNNAEPSLGGLMQMTSLKKLRKVMEINFISQIGVMQTVSEVMIRQRYGSIVAIAFAEGPEAEKENLAYGSSKAAFVLASRMMSKELGPYHIRVNVVAPRLVGTDMEINKSQEARQKIWDEDSKKRLGTSKGIADIVYFLATEESCFMTGSVVNVDGGQL